MIKIYNYINKMIILIILKMILLHLILLIQTIINVLFIISLWWIKNDHY